MNESRNKTMSATLFDTHPEYSERLPVRILSDASGITIVPQGYGDFGSADGHGCPLFLELYGGRLRLIVFANINSEDPTIVDLEAASEVARTTPKYPHSETKGR